MRREVKTLVQLYRDDKIGVRTLSEELDKMSCTPEEKLEAMKIALATITEG